MSRPVCARTATLCLLFGWLIGCGSGGAGQEPSGSDADAKVSSTDTDAPAEAAAASAVDSGIDAVPFEASQVDTQLDDPHDAYADPYDEADDAPRAHPQSQFCGDAIRDPMLEECDDGPTAGDDACTSDCRVHDTPWLDAAP